MMKERPINYSTPMVIARNEGRKRMTRRVARLADTGRVKEPGSSRNWHPDDPNAALACPYGQPGDRLWVREEHRIVATEWRECKWVPSSGSVVVQYQSDLVERDCEVSKADWEKLEARKTPLDNWMRARFMLRALSRGIDEITSVRLERLNQISEADAQAEGCEPFEDDHGKYQARVAFCDLWESINGPDSWDLNPWVWVVEFKRLEL